MPSTLPTSLTLGSLRVDTPVVLAPMAGITNAAYRRLCLEQMEAQGSRGLFVCEMITSRGLVEGDQHTRDMLVFDDLETLRSVQLYGTDPVYVGKAAEILCAEYGVAHIDLNFGCPVPKVTRKGGGGALPWKRVLLGQILEAAVAAAAPYDVPVTMKTRKGLDEDHLTYLDAGRIAEESGVAAIALHGRTVAQAYSGEADWDAIARLVDGVDIARADQPGHGPRTGFQERGRDQISPGFPCPGGHAPGISFILERHIPGTRHLHCGPHLPG